MDVRLLLATSGRHPALPGPRVLLVCRYLHGGREIKTVGGTTKTVAERFVPADRTASR